MSSQAGIFYFDDREIAAYEADVIRDWVRFDGCESPTSHRGAGAFVAYAGSHLNGRTPRHTPFCGQTCTVTFDGRLDNRKDLLLRLRGSLRADTSDAAVAAAA